MNSPGNQIKNLSDHLTQQAEWILNKIENTFNGTFTG